MASTEQHVCVREGKGGRRHQWGWRRCERNRRTHHDDERDYVDPAATMTVITTDRPLGFLAGLAD